MTGCHVGNFALFAGGTTGSGASDVVDVYNASLTRSTTKLRDARSTTGATHLGDFAIFAGGNTGGGAGNFMNQVTSIDSFDTSLTLTPLRDLTTGLGNCTQAATIGNYALVGGGGGLNKYKSVDTFISL